MKYRLGQRTNSGNKGGYKQVQPEQLRRKLLAKRSMYQLQRKLLAKRGMIHATIETKFQRGRESRENKEGHDTCNTCSKDPKYITLSLF